MLRKKVVMRRLSRSTSTAQDRLTMLVPALRPLNRLVFAREEVFSCYDVVAKYIERTNAPCLGRWQSILLNESLCCCQSAWADT